ncbi:MAG: hypothetical protein GAK34_03585 [Delftia tsuruhatensis]|nr:MAG: hypothetical protein GAK34_03585 [Delftia tsuruhatensis]
MDKEIKAHHVDSVFAIHHDLPVVVAAIPDNGGIHIAGRMVA